MSKRLLKVAAGINLAIGGVVLLFSLLIGMTGFLAVFGMIGGILAIIRLAVGATFLMVANKDGEEFIKGRNYIMVMSIISILMGHIVTFILGIIAYTCMCEEVPIEARIKHELTEEEKTQKRLRNLLALGCALVLLSGVIFAGTTWTTLSGLGKTVALVGAAVIFQGLSYFAERKFNLKTSSVTYYILSNAFCILAVISAGYFEVFGQWFSLNGLGKELYFVFLFAIVAGLTYISYLKYNEKSLFYIFDLALLMMLTSGLMFFNAGKDIILFVIISILAIFALLPKKNEIIAKSVNLAKVLLPLVSVILITFIARMKAEDRLIFNLLSFGITFVLAYYIAIIDKNLFYEIFAPIFTLVAAFTLSVVLNTDSKVIFLQLLLISVIVYMIGYCKREQKHLFTATSIACDLALLYIFIDSLKLGYNYYSIAATLALLGISIAVSVSKEFGKYHFEILLEPVKVVLLSYAIYELFYIFEYVENALFLALVSLIFALICIFKKEFMKKLYFAGAVLSVAVVMFTNAMEFAPVSQALAVISLTILLFIAVRAKNAEFAKYKELVYGLLLMGLAIFSLNTFIHFELKLVGIILLTVIYSILFISFNKAEIFRCFTIAALLIPYVMILPISTWNDTVNYILYSLPWIALIFIYTRGFLASADLEIVNIIEGVALSIWYLTVSSEIALEVAIFIGVISFVSILIGYKSEKWIALYYTGVAFLILNTIIQLKEFWTSIPMWAYILVSGLILIGIVTYKEYTKAIKKDEAEKVEAEILESPKANVPKQPLDSRVIIAGSIFYIVFVPILLKII